MLEVETSHGLAVAHVRRVDDPRGLLVLGHGAGGGIEAPDLLAVADTAQDLGFAVALVLQPYRAAGRKAPPRAPALDAAWTDVVAVMRRDLGGQDLGGQDLGGQDLVDRPLVVGGRSAGARVACRTAVATGAVGALCLAFPLRPPGRPEAPSRLPELEAAGVPVLVVQGVRDPYGMPPEAPGRSVVTVDGDHSLRSGLDGVRAATRDWLPRVAGPGTPQPRPGTGPGLGGVS